MILIGNEKGLGFVGREKRRLITRLLSV